MKKIEAVIRPECLKNVLEELQKLGYPGMTITEVRGHGNQKGLVRIWRGEVYRVDFLPKLKLETVVVDEDLPKVVDVLVKAARTGDPGDGKIFIYEVEDVVRIRTGDSGIHAI